MYFIKIKYYYKNKISSSSIAGCPYLITFSLSTFVNGKIKILSAPVNSGSNFSEISLLYFVMLLKYLFVFLSNCEYNLN